MESENLKKGVLLNTFSNYLYRMVWVVVGIISTPLLIKSLGEVGFGFWSWIWFVFGYSILLDFGFGYSVQKYTAEFSVTRDSKSFNRLITTVIGSYSFLATLIIITALILQPFLDVLICFPEETDVFFYKKVFIIFGVMLAFAFPTGVFSEILQGMKKTYIKNWIAIIHCMVNVFAIYIVYKYSYSILSLAVISIGLVLVKNLSMAFFCYRIIPEMSIRPQYFSFKYLKEITSFSLYAYLSICANMVILKTDQIVLGALLGTTAVAAYQIGTKIPLMASEFAQQFQTNLAPITAALYKNREYKRLQSILVRSQKYVALFSFILFLMTTVFVAPVLNVWLASESFSLSDDVIYVAYIMNAALFIRIVWRSVSANVLFMAERHQFLSKVSMSEALANLILSVIFVSLIGVTGVAFGTLVPTIIFSMFFIFPEAARFSKYPIFSYITRIYLPITVILVPCAFILLHFYVQFPAEVYMALIKGDQIIQLGISDYVVNGRLYVLCIISAYCAVSLAVYFVLAYFCILDISERDQIKTLVLKVRGPFKRVCIGD